jgi:hypothetical protein
MINLVTATIGLGGACYFTACAATEPADHDAPVGEAQEAVCSCSSPSSLCWTTGLPSVCYCTNLNTDANNCGSCNHVCSLQHATAACLSGVCITATCNTGFGNCDGNTYNGCETNLNTDPNHCGGCTNAPCTTSVAHAHPTCTNGSCSFACDAPGYTLVTLNGTSVCAQTCSSNEQCAGNAAGVFCTNGHCALPGEVTCTPGSTCAGGATCCATNGGLGPGGFCTDLNWDAANCTVCNTPNLCASSNTCCNVGGIANTTTPDGSCVAPQGSTVVYKDLCPPQ